MASKDEKTPTAGLDTICLQSMEPKDKELVAQLIANAMNSEEGDQARETLKFHFACSHQGIDDGRTYFVLKENEVVRGVIGLHRYLWGPRENVWLAWFAVDPALRGTGQGKRLLDFVLKEAVAAGYARLYIETYSTPEFEDARNFYQMKGFVPTGVVSSYLPGGGDMIVYAKELTHHA